MDLTSDLPFWTVRNGLLRIYPPLEKNIHCEALVVGGGISGALLAHRLTGKGINCVLIDRRDIGFGSTSASTALLQYEIDTPLHELREKVGAGVAERAYRAGLESIERIQKLAGRDCGFAMRPSLQVAVRASDRKGLEKEYKTRRALRFPVAWLERSDVRALGLNAACALRSGVAAEVDPYRLTHRLLHLAHAKGLRIFDRTAALRYTHSRDHVTVETDRGHRIRCRRIFFATGYETQDLFPKKIVTLKSTYAFVSEPVADLACWKNRSLVWGTGNPYLYTRTTSDNRILVGGEDDGVVNPKRRDAQIGRKTKILIRRFHSLCPQISIEPAFSWAGIFGSTKDGLAYIGKQKSFPLAYFALGFGGNGITFSEIASRILADIFLGRANPDQKVFSFDR